MSDELTPVEKNSLKWILFLDKYDRLCSDQVRVSSYEDFYREVTGLVRSLR